MIAKFLTSGIAAMLAIAGAGALQAQVATSSPPTGDATAQESAARTPDPGVIRGVKVFDMGGVTLGEVADLASKDGRLQAILTVGTVTGHPDRLVAIPYSELRVEGGVVRYDTTWEQLVEMTPYDPTEGPAVSTSNR